jgi:hypothetical protein
MSTVSNTRRVQAIGGTQRVSLAVLTWLVCLVLTVPIQNAAAATVSVTGAEQTVYDWSQMACFPHQFPDGPTRAFRDSQGRIQLILAHIENSRMVGADFNSLVRDCTVIRGSPNDPFAGHYNNTNFISTLNTVNGSNVVALGLNEHRVNTNPALCPSGRSADCQYASVVHFTSTDAGASYNITSPPSQYVAGVPYRYWPNLGRHGIAEPSNIVEKDGFYYTMLLSLRSTREQRSGVCLMRTRDLGDPTSWRAWDGAGFTVRFVNPYLEPGVAPERHVCHPVSFDQIGQLERSLTYNTYLNKFVVFGTDSKFDPQRQTLVRAFYYSFSDDLINWSDRQLLLELSQTCGLDRAYPSVIDHLSTDRNFSRAGQHAYLYYTRFNFTNCQVTNDRDLVRVPIDFAQ